VKAFEEGILFGMFVEKAINPGIKVDDAVVRKHYDDHLEEFSAPERIRGEDLAFSGREDASDALEKLRRGADFKWVMVNAPGQAGEKTRERVFPPERTYIARNDLTASVGEAVAGAGPGEYRLYESRRGNSSYCMSWRWSPEAVSVRIGPGEDQGEDVRGRTAEIRGRVGRETAGGIRDQGVRNRRNAEEDLRSFRRRARREGRNHGEA